MNHTCHIQIEDGNSVTYLLKVWGPVRPAVEAWKPRGRAHEAGEGEALDKSVEFYLVRAWIDVALKPGLEMRLDYPAVPSSQRDRIEDHLRKVHLEEIEAKFLADFVARKGPVRTNDRTRE